MRKVLGTMGLGGLALTTVLASTVVAPQAARAQFFWDQPRFSADDVARAVVERGFRPIHRPFRNDQVYIADVFDRRGRQERLIVSADSGEIVQRFFVEGTRNLRSDVDPTIAPGPVPPGRIPNEDNQPSLFSRLFGGDGQDKQEHQEQQQPSQFEPNYALPAPVRPRPKRVPRVVERAPETVPPYAPIESAPLAPVTPAAVAPATAPSPVATVAPQPAQAILPPAQPAAAPPAPSSGRVTSKDPLAIPGSREDDDKTPKPAAFAVAHPAPKPAAPAPAPPKAPEVKSVPVAPLD